MRHEELIGAWSLESAIAKGTKGDELLVYGETPGGLLIYTASGHMATVLMARGRPKFASGDPRGGTTEEIKKAFEGFDAYAGTYECDPEAGTVTHYGEVARFPNWEDTAQVRHVQLHGDRLHLSSTPIQALGQAWVVYLTWRRA